MTPEGPPPETDPIAAELRTVRGLVADLRAIVWEASAPTGDFTFVSEGVKQILGYSPQEWLADPRFWSEHLHPDDRERSVSRLARASMSDSSFDAEYRFIAEDGSVRWLRDIGHTVNDADGRPALVRGVITDVTDRRTMEGDLGEAEMRFHRLAESLPAIVYLEQASDDPAELGRMLYVSPRVEEILGISRSEWVEDPLAWTRQFHPDDRERLAAEHERASQRGSSLSVEYRMYGRDGRVVWFRDEAALIRSETGASYWQGIMYDITDRRQIEDHLREAERRYEALLAQLPVIAYAEETGGETPRSVYVHPRVEAMLGISPEEWLADPRAWTSALHPDDRAAVLDSKMRAHLADAPFLADYRLITRDGRTIWLQDRSMVVPEESGRPRYRQGVLLDITATKDAEAGLAEAEERLQELLAGAPTISFIGPLDAPKAKLYISPRTSDVLGYTPSDWYGDPNLWTRIVEPQDREVATQLGPGQTESTYRVHDSMGRTVWVRETAHIVKDAGGTPRYWQGTMVDITSTMRSEELERELASARAAAEQLRAADEMKNTFLQAVSHDLRTPLAAILGLALTLKREDLDIGAKETRDIAGRIAQNAQRLDRIVTDLLDLDRLSQGILEPDLVEVDVGDVVRELVHSFGPISGSKVDLLTGSVVVAADPAIVGRIVENLLVNAAKHTPEGSHIWVKVEPAEGGALLIVEDDGPGVPESDRERIFDAFLQGEEEPSAEGSGVGLALVARFAELLGGRAWVQERVGGGASFRVFLAEDPSDPGAGPDQRAAAGSSEANQA